MRHVDAHTPVYCTATNTHRALTTAQLSSAQLSSAQLSVAVAAASAHVYRLHLAVARGIDGGVAGPGAGQHVEVLQSSPQTMQQQQRRRRRRRWWRRRHRAPAESRGRRRGRSHCTTSTPNRQSRHSLAHMAPHCTDRDDGNELWIAQLHLNELHAAARASRSAGRWIGIGLQRHGERRAAAAYRACAQAVCSEASKAPHIDDAIKIQQSSIHQSINQSIHQSINPSINSSSGSNQIGEGVGSAAARSVG